LSAIGFTQSSGLIGTWTLIATGDTIYACLGSGSCAPTPGPLPLLGAGAAFGWRRRLRKRIATPLTTPAQA
jgi:MYXO-CTERM domain-containing protein